MRQAQDMPYLKPRIKNIWCNQHAIFETRSEINSIQTSHVLVTMYRTSPLLSLELFIKATRKAKERCIYICYTPYLNDAKKAAYPCFSMRCRNYALVFLDMGYASADRFLVTPSIIKEKAP